MWFVCCVQFSSAASAERIISGRASSLRRVALSRPVTAVPVSCLPSMVWGKAAAPFDANEMLDKARGSGTLCIMPFRKFGPDESTRFFTACIQEPSVLVELYASGHAPGVVGFQALAQFLRTPGCRLRHVCIGDSASGDDLLKELAAGLGHEPCSLEVVDLEYKGITAAGMDSLGMLFGTGAFAQVTTLKLARNPGAGDVGLSSLLRGTGSGMDRLCSLDVSECGLSAASMQLVGSVAQRGGLQQLAEFRFSNNQDDGDAVARACAALLRASPRLRALFLCGLCVSGAGAAALASTLRESALEELRLGSNAHIGDEGVGAIASAIANSRLKVLDVSKCGVGDQGARELACSGLTTIDLSHNSLGRDGCDALLGSESLQVLRLFANPALGSSYTPESIGAAMRVARNVRHLDVGGCALGGTNAAALCNALCVSPDSAPRLDCLEICANDFSEADGECVEAIAQLRTSRPGLDVFWRTNKS